MSAFKDFDKKPGVIVKNLVLKEQKLQLKSIWREKI